MERPGLVLRHQPIRDHSDSILMTVDGSVDPKSTTQWKNEFDALLAKGIKRFILDCERLTYINSSGLAYLLNVAGTVKTKSGGVALAAVDSKIMVIFKMMGVMELFSFYPTFADALKDLDEKLARELRDVGPALVLEEPPPPPKPNRVITPPKLAPRPGPDTSRRMIRPPAPPPENAFVRFFKALFGIEESRPFFRRLSRKRL